MKNRKLKLFAKKLSKKLKYILPVTFFCIMGMGMIVSLIIPLRPTFSDSEKRELTKFPSFAFESFWEGEYTAQIDKWFADTFPFRETLININNSISELRGFGDKVYGINSNADTEIPQATTGESTTEITTTEPTEPTVPEQKDFVTQTLDSIVVIGNTGYEYCSFKQEVADKYISVVNKTAESLHGISTVYDMLVPTSTDITMSESVRSSLSSANQSEIMDYIFNSFSDKVVDVNIYKNLRMHRDEYVYFRSDHHWTALGAYYAYEEYARVRQLTAVPLSRYTEVDYGDFLGSFYNKTGSSEMKKTPDRLIAYQPYFNSTLKYTTTAGKTYDWDLVHDVTNYKSNSKYSAFAAGDNPMTVIENTSRTSGKKLLVIKESFGNAVIPFLTAHYKNVYVIDYRYYNGGIIDFAKENGIDDVIFINNMSAVRSAKLIDRMESINY